jgi:hypothetical protein
VACYRVTFTFNFTLCKDALDTLKTDFHINCISNFSSYLTENACRVNYKDQSVTAVLGSNQYIVCCGNTKLSDEVRGLLMLQQGVPAVTTGL